MPWEIRTELLSHSSSKILRVAQEHGGAITWAHEITSDTRADGIAAQADFRGSFCIRTADCLPLVLATADTACALHVSRKSLVAGLLEKVPKVLDVSRVTQVFIGPHICAEHFVFEAVGPAVAAFQQKFPFACHTSRAGLHLSLEKVVAEYVQRWGVAANTISRDNRCTFETSDLPSYRRTLRDKTQLSDHVATIVVSASI